mmetsp:Transcript_23452/g.66940  ORF Transcript_23452/g.66940 Transcript_23452/m.66940 type:complete len:233 (+) Transcript_23452:473-1171(+)
MQGILAAPLLSSQQVHLWEAPGPSVCRHPGPFLSTHLRCTLHRLLDLPGYAVDTRAARRVHAAQLHHALQGLPVRLRRRHEICLGHVGLLHLLLGCRGPGHPQLRPAPWTSERFQHVPHRGLHGQCHSHLGRVVLLAPLRQVRAEQIQSGRRRRRPLHGAVPHEPGQVHVDAEHQQEQLDRREEGGRPVPPPDVLRLLLLLGLPALLGGDHVERLPPRQLHLRAAGQPAVTG